MINERLEITIRRVIRVLRKLNRRLNNNKVNATIIAKARVFDQGEELRNTTLYIGNNADSINRKPSQQDSGIIQGTIIMD